MIDQRNDLTADLGAGKAGFDQTLARLKRVNNAFTKRSGKLTQFSEELAKVSAVEEYQALDAIFEKNGATPESESPSTSPSPRRGHRLERYLAMLPREAGPRANVAIFHLSQPWNDFFPSPWR